MVVPPPNPPGGGWQPATPSDGMLRGKWWEIYQDPQLNQLEEHIATNNQSLRQALETYLAARDQVTAARSALYPRSPPGLPFAHDNISQERALLPAKQAHQLQRSGRGRPGSWEPDFWGRIRRTVEPPARTPRPAPPTWPTST